jgi:hypothetical protein
MMCRCSRAAPVRVDPTDQDVLGRDPHHLARRNAILLGFFVSRLLNRLLL